MTIVAKALYGLFSRVFAQVLQKLMQLRLTKLYAVTLD
jgi:hypothetical protein